jgi:hypothetical protein
LLCATFDQNFNLLKALIQYLVEVEKHIGSIPSVKITAELHRVFH